VIIHHPSLNEQPAKHTYLWASIMASAILFCFCTTQKHLVAKI
jgi:hypothetical protein